MLEHAREQDGLALDVLDRDPASPKSLDDVGVPAELMHDLDELRAPLEELEGLCGDLAASCFGRAHADARASRAASSRSQFDDRRLREAQRAPCVPNSGHEPVRNEPSHRAFAHAGRACSFTTIAWAIAFAKSHPEQKPCHVRGCAGGRVSQLANSSVFVATIQKHAAIRHLHGWFARREANREWLNLDIAKLVIVRLGFVARSTGTLGGYLVEHLWRRGKDGKPTWVVDTPKNHMKEGHPAWSPELAEWLGRTTRIEAQ
jgi:hypothetical protein